MKLEDLPTDVLRLAYAMFSDAPWDEAITKIMARRGEPYNLQHMKLPSYYGTGNVSNACIEHSDERVQLDIEHNLRKFLPKYRSLYATYADILWQLHLEHNIVANL